MDTLILAAKILNRVEQIVKRNRKFLPFRNSRNTGIGDGEDNESLTIWSPDAGVINARVANIVFFRSGRVHIDTRLGKDYGGNWVTHRCSMEEPSFCDDFCEVLEHYGLIPIEAGDTIWNP